MTWIVLQHYTRKGGGSDLLIAFAHNNADLLYLTYADSHVHVSYDHTGAFLLVQAKLNCPHPIFSSAG